MARLSVNSSTPLLIWPTTGRGATILQAAVLKDSCSLSSLYCDEKQLLGGLSQMLHPRRQQQGKTTINPYTLAKSPYSILRDECNTPCRHPPTHIWSKQDRITPKAFGRNGCVEQEVIQV